MRRGQSSFGGYVVDPAALDRRFVVELLVDGLPVQRALADQFDAVLAGQNLGDACYGFSFQVAADLATDANCIEARLANLDDPVGAPVMLDRPIDAEPATAPADSEVEWQGGLRFIAWMARRDRELARIVVTIDGERIVEARAGAWHHNGLVGADARADPAFLIDLPPRFADGRVRRARFFDEAGTELRHSPHPFVAYENGLKATIDRLGEIESERLRGDLFDKLVPMALPFTDFPRWQERFPPPPLPKGKSKRKAFASAVILVGESDAGATIETLEAQRQADWVGLDLPYCDDAQSIALSSLRAFLDTDGKDSDVVVFVQSGLRLHPEALARLHLALAAAPAALMAHGDLIVEEAGRPPLPLFFGAFDYERALEQGYAARFFAARRAAITPLLRLDKISLPQIVLALAGNPRDARKHAACVPLCLATASPYAGVAAGRALQRAAQIHLAARGIAATVVAGAGSLMPAVHVMRPPAQSAVSIIIPVRNKAALLRRCLETLKPAQRRVKTEVLIVDNGSNEPAMLALLAGLDGKEARVLRMPGPFNFSKLNNQAAAAARGDVLCLLNNDIEALDGNWLDEMLGRLAEPDVGAVGALLVWPSGVVQHGGVVLGPNLGAAHAFTDRIDDDPGYGDLLRVAREVSAVTAACLVTRRADYQAVGGLDEIAFPVNFNDVDYCLKLRAAGKRIVFTPHARLTHLESASRGADARPDQARRFEGELRRLRERWLEQLVADPYYSGALSLDPQPFTGLAWPPRH